MKAGWAVALAATSVASLVAFGTAWWEDPDPLRASCASLAAIAAGFVAFRLTSRGDIAGSAALLTAVWPGRVWATSPIILVALALVLLPLIPRVRRPLELTAAFFFALAASLWLTNGEFATAIIAATGALVLSGIRPDAPTQGMFRAVRFVSLYFPAAAILVLLVLNAVTDRGDRIGPAEAVPWSLGVFVVLSLISMTGLGLERLLRSDARAQTWIWVSLAISASLIAQSIPSRDPSTVLGAAYMLAPLGAVLVNLFFAWMTRGLKGAKKAFFLAPIFLAFLGTLLFLSFISAGN